MISLLRRSLLGGVYDRVHHDHLHWPYAISCRRYTTYFAIWAVTDPFMNKYQGLLGEEPVTRLVGENVSRLEAMTGGY